MCLLTRSVQRLQLAILWELGSYQDLLSGILSLIKLRRLHCVEGRNRKKTTGSPIVKESYKKGLTKKTECWHLKFVLRILVFFPWKKGGGLAYTGRLTRGGAGSRSAPRRLEWGTVLLADRLAGSDGAASRAENRSEWRAREASKRVGRQTSAAEIGLIGRSWAKRPFTRFFMERRDFQSLLGLSGASSPNLLPFPRKGSWMRTTNFICQHQTSTEF